MNANRIIPIVLLLSCATHAGTIPADFLRDYVAQFNAGDDEKVVNLIPNAAAADWMLANVPLFQCPDKTLEQTYYFRWWTYRKHIRKIGDYICLTEFLPRNPVSSAVGHHVMEGRWLRDKSYLDQDLLYWLRGTAGHPNDKHNYSSWTVYAAYQRYLVNNDSAFITGMLDDFVRDYQAWESEKFLPDQGLYWQLETRDAMEDSINGARKKPGLRPSINSYMYGNALAIAAIADLADKPDLAGTYRAKAAGLKQAVQRKLWDDGAKFFKVRWEDGTFSDAREAIGFIPWYFNLPDRGEAYAQAWSQLTDPKGFWAPFGLTTAERRHPAFRTHGSGHSCEWDGPVWPFATSQTLTALGNLLNNYPAQHYITRADYLQALQTYAKSMQLDGHPYIGEYLDESTGKWLRNDLERGRHYNHSTFCDLVINGLIGLRPQNGATIELNPLLPADSWDSFCLENVPYHHHLLTVIWDETGKKYDQKPGLTLEVDGKVLAHSPTLGRITATMPEP